MKSSEGPEDSVGSGNGQEFFLWGGRTALGNGRTDIITDPQGVTSEISLIGTSASSSLKWEVFKYPYCSKYSQQTGSSICLHS